VQREVDVDGVRISYLDRGCGPPVVLLHGMVSSGSTWHSVVPVLAAAGRRVIAPDLRGHGASDRPGSYRLADFHRDVHGLLDHLGLDTVDLVGHSLGGHVASLVAQHEPARVRRLVIEDAPPPPRRPGQAAATFQRRTDWRSVRRIMGALRTFDRRMARPVLTELRTPDPAWWDRLPRITAPTLLLSGGPTSHVSPLRLAELTDAIPDCRLVTIPAGHRIHSLRPAEFCAHLVPFLA
jgi:pimeloyl-ACP methyl ester carboxylesterase